MKSPLIYLLALSMMVITACQPVLPPEVDELSGTEWVLVSINAETDLVGNPPTLIFDGQDVSGNASCNFYRGDYRVKGYLLSLGDLARTEMYCQEPEGVMDQENRFLLILSAAESFVLAEDSLVISGEQGELSFQPQGSDPAPAPATPISAVVTQELPTATPEQPSPTPAPVLVPPDGWQEYKDDGAGVAIFIPGDWYITGVTPGEYAILQSYPEDKYVGGGRREPGDTKCDLNLNPSTASVEELILTWEESPITTVLSEQEFTYQSGLTGRRFELDSMGLTRVYTAGFDAGLVKLVCFGNFTIVDQIAGWLHMAD